MGKLFEAYVEIGAKADAYDEAVDKAEDRLNRLVSKPSDVSINASVNESGGGLAGGMAASSAAMLAQVGMIGSMLRKTFMTAVPSIQRMEKAMHGVADVAGVLNNKMYDRTLRQRIDTTNSKMLKGLYEAEQSARRFNDNLAFAISTARRLGKSLTLGMLGGSRNKFDLPGFDSQAFSVANSKMAKLRAVAVAPLRVATGGGSGGSGGGLGGGIVGALGLGAGIGLISKTILMASNLNETISKTEIVFKKSTDVVTSGAARMAKAFGIPTREYLDAAASIGLIAKASGLTEAKAAGLAVQLTDLAADASSFYNVPLADALQTMRSALVGESEPIRKFGVLLNEAAVNAEALRLGLARTKDTISEGAKIQARASLITKGMADASGDLDRTSTSLANRLREIQGRIANMATTIGQHFLPAAEQLGRELSDIGKSLNGGLGNAAGIFQAIADSMMAAAKWTGILYRNFSLVTKLAASMGKDFGNYLLDGLKSVGKYLIEWGKYVAELIGYNIQKSLHEATKGTSFETSKPTTKVSSGAPKPNDRLYLSDKAKWIKMQEAYQGYQASQGPQAPTFKGPSLEASKATQDLTGSIKSRELGVNIGRGFQDAMAKLKTFGPGLLKNYGDKAKSSLEFDKLGKADMTGTSDMIKKSMEMLTDKKRGAVPNHPLNRLERFRKHQEEAIAGMLGANRGGVAPASDKDRKTEFTDAEGLAKKLIEASLDGDLQKKALAATEHVGEGVDKLVDLIKKQGKGAMAVFGG